MEIIREVPDRLVCPIGFRFVASTVAEIEEPAEVEFDELKRCAACSVVTGRDNQLPGGRLLVGNLRRSMVGRGKGCCDGKHSHLC